MKHVHFESLYGIITIIVPIICVDVASVQIFDLKEDPDHMY